MDLFVHPDLEAMLVKLYNDSFTIKTYTKIPNVDARPKTFITVHASGGQRRNKILDMPTITVRSWAEDEPTAFKIIQECRALVYATSQIDGYTVYKVQEYSSPVNYPDIDTGIPRYDWTAAIGVRLNRHSEKEDSRYLNK